MSTSGSFLKGIKAVIFDIYGTLLISGSGDVGTAIEAGSTEAFAEALRRLGIGNIQNESVVRIKKLFFDLIEEDHSKLWADGYPFPEVDIIRIWTEIFTDSELISISPELEALEPSIAAATYESIVNPVNIMPGADILLNKLKNAGLSLGIISNAQFYTPIVFELSFGAGFDQYDFDPSLCLFSYHERRAKPDSFLFDKMSAALGKLGISPAEAVFIGNDMLKDIMPASATGYKTALFAGDKRSLRLRKDHDACSNIKPDVIVTNLLDLFDFIQEG